MAGVRIFTEYARENTTPFGFNKGMVVSKDSETGIAVDLDNPTFTWRDLEGPINIRTVGLASPTFSTYIGNLKEYKFSVNDEVHRSFHIPHDYVKGSDMYIHVHWSHIHPSLISGGIVMAMEISYSKGHDQEEFSTPVTIAIPDTANILPYRHKITEVQFTSSTPTASQIDTTLIEPDGILLTRLYLSSNTLNPATDPFIHFSDIHYLSTNIGTKNKIPDFYA